jgi:hypothetical protein
MLNTTDLEDVFWEKETCGNRHAARMGKKRPAYWILVRIHEGRRQLGRPRLDGG